MADRGCNTATAQAEYLGVYISTITRVLAGDVQPSGAFVAIACSRLGVEIDDLFEVAPAATHRAAV
jgi:transcriptional regulator with XRE-family HTH domain